MARAKRTDRADARRRWRQASTGELDGAAPVDETPAAAPASRAPSAAKAAPKPGERPSIIAAFRNAYRPARVREDITALPGLLGTRAFLISVALVVGGTLAVAVAPGNVVSNLAFQALVVPPAMAPIFVVGFFARRASYLLGLLVAVVDVLAYAFFVYAVAPGLDTATKIDAVQQQQLIFSAISVGPVSGIFFAAAAAWYRRFLTLSNANAQQRAKSRQQQRPGAGRPARG